MNRFKYFLTLFLLLSAVSVEAAKPDLLTYVSHKWRIIWYSDAGVVTNMEAKKQQLHLRSDGTGTMFMLGENLGPVEWSVEGKKTIFFSDDPVAKPYLVKVKMYKDEKHMMFTGTMPNGVKRVVYFEILSGRP